MNQAAVISAARARLGHAPGVQEKFEAALRWARGLDSSARNSAGLNPPPSIAHDPDVQKVTARAWRAAEPYRDQLMRIIQGAGLSRSSTRQVVGTFFAGLQVPDGWL